MSVEIERELKFKAPEDIESIIEREGFKKSRVIRQIDDYYIVNKAIGSEQHYLRIRHPSDSSTMASLDYHVATSDVETRETEVKFEDQKKLSLILGFLGYPLVCTVDKKRSVYEGEGLELTVDRIDGLGTFVEIEAKNESISTETLFEIADRIGLSRTSRVVNVGYPDLILDHNRVTAVRPSPTSPAIRENFPKK